MSIPNFPEDLVPVLALAFAAGLVTQLARQLAQAVTPSVRRVLALAIAAGIAALTVVALLSALMSPPPAAAFLLASACVTGWSGPHILTRLGTLIERRLGLTPPAPEPISEPTSRPISENGAEDTPASPTNRAK